MHHRREPRGFFLEKRGDVVATFRRAVQPLASSPGVLADYHSMGPGRKSGRASKVACTLRPGTASDLWWG